MAKDVCEINIFDRRKVKTLKDLMKSERVVVRLSETFKVLGDPTRIKIIQVLSLEELCVCDIADLLGMSDSAISHQLRVLRNLKLVKYRRQGKMAYYSLDDAHITQLFECALEHVTEGV